MPESKDFKIYFATNDKKRDQKFIDSIGLKVELVDIADFKYVKVLATSKYLINNSSFPAYFIRRDEPGVPTDMAWNTVKDIRKTNAFWN